MFGKLKEKLKSWTKKVSEETQETSYEEFEKLNDDEVDSKLKKELSKKKKLKAEKKLEEETNGNLIAPQLKQLLPNAEKSVEKLKEKKGIFKNTKIIDSKSFEKYSEDLEMILIENNVAFEVVEKIIYELKEKIVGKELNKKELETQIKKNLKEIISDVLVKPFDIVEEIKDKPSPYVILFCGINGAGKTTTIAKFASLLKLKKILCVFGAADTFRAASIEQIKKHGENLKVDVIAHDYGSDPASVGFDAISYAKKNNIKAVLIDTAGRMHTAKNLLSEMEKIKRVTNPDRVIFLGESITGNDAVDQVKAFNETIGIDGIILSKADIDEKGGTALSVGYMTKKPILFLGTGQNYDDLEKFDKEKFIEKLGLQ